MGQMLKNIERTIWKGHKLQKEGWGNFTTNSPIEKEKPNAYSPSIKKRSQVKA